MLQPVRELVRPPNQLHLSQADLAEDISCLLNASNPAAPSNVARYNLRERAYKLDSSVDHIIHHYSSQGYLVHVDSEQAQRQSAQEQVTPQCPPFFGGHNALPLARSVLCPPAHFTPVEMTNSTRFMRMQAGRRMMHGVVLICDLQAQQETETREGGTDVEAASPTADPTQLRNPFNYSDRAAQVRSRPLI